MHFLYAPIFSPSPYQVSLQTVGATYFVLRTRLGNQPQDFLQRHAHIKRTTLGPTTKATELINLQRSAEDVVRYLFDGEYDY